MADEVDRANEYAEVDRQDAIRRASKPMPPGEPGECIYCGEQSQRLVGGACAPCRDKRRLP